jgi:uncharacterized protein
MPTLEQAREWYKDADPVHAIDHIERVYNMATYLANEEGADLEIVQAAALLHDATGRVVDGDASARLQHHEASALFAGEILSSESWEADRIAAVQHCIRAHRFRSTGETPETPEAKVLFDADKLDVTGAIGIVRVIAYSTIVNQPIYTQPSDRFMSSGEKEPGEGHSGYHEYLIKIRKIPDLLHTPAARFIAKKRHAVIQSFFEQLIDEMTFDG